MVIDGDCVGMMDERASEASKVCSSSSASSWKVSGRDGVGGKLCGPDVDMGTGDESICVNSPGAEHDLVKLKTGPGDESRSAMVHGLEDDD